MTAPDDRPWEQPGAVRRDAEPHRGVFLSRLTEVSIICTCASLCVISGCLALLLASITLVLAGRDLEMMRAGLMDPGGRVLTEMARKDALFCVVLNLLVLLVGGLIMVVVLTR